MAAKTLKTTCFVSSRRRHTRIKGDYTSTVCFFFSSRRRHTRLQGDWSSDVCSSDLASDKFGLVRLVAPLTAPRERDGIGGEREHEGIGQVGRVLFVFREHARPAFAALEVEVLPRQFFHEGIVLRGPPVTLGNLTVAGREPFLRLEPELRAQVLVAIDALQRRGFLDVDAPDGEPQP